MPELFKRIRYGQSNTQKKHTDTQIHTEQSEIFKKD